MQEGRGHKKTLEGLVTSTSMAKTIVVDVTRTVRHHKYNKFVKKNARYYAHDENGTCGVGDRVVISENRPVSKLKRWRLLRVVEKSVE